MTDDNEGRRDGLWSAEDWRRAFVEGMKWWQYKATGFTAFPAEVDDAEVEAERRYAALAAPAPAAQPAKSGERAVALPEIVDTWVELSDGKLSPSNGSEDSPDWPRYVLIDEQEWERFTSAHAATIAPQGGKEKP